MQHFHVENSYYNVYKRIFKDRCTFHSLGPGCRQEVRTRSRVKLLSAFLQAYTFEWLMFRTRSEHLPNNSVRSEKESGRGKGVRERESKLFRALL